VICEEDTKVTVPQAVPLIETLTPEMKLLPLMVRVVPPANAPAEGDTILIDGARRYVKADERVADCASMGFVTCTLKVPAEVAPELQTICVAVTDVVPQETPENETVAPVTNPVPVIVTAVPPASAPPLGETVDIVGAAL
jgi:hypothetical protein